MNTNSTAQWSRAIVASCLAAGLLSGCSKKETTSSPAPEQKAAQPSTAATPAQQQSAAEINLPTPFGRSTDDLDAMLTRRNIRAIVIMNPIGFFYTKGRPMGANYEALRDLQTFVNQKYKTDTLRVKVSFIPMRPDQVEAALQQGVGDVVAYGLVVTPEREQKLSFTSPIQTNVDKVVVSGKDFGEPPNLEGLGGKQIWLNPLTVNYQRVQALNEKLKQQGKPVIDLKAADQHLLEDDLVQMVNAGLLPATVVSGTRAKLWSQVLPNLVVHSNLVIASGENLAWAVRKNNPEFLQLLNEFIPSHAVGTSFGNTLVRRYLQNTKFVKDNTSAQEMAKFNATAELFKKYAGQYGFDYLMIVAQGYQESRLNQKAHNPSGAVGIMQVIPKYAAANPINVKNVFAVDGNIEAGVKMLRNIQDQYFNDPNIDQVDKTLMVFASYNAGPNRIAQLRKQAASQGLDPKKWFNNVELMVAQDVGQETVTYVANIYKYYVAYQLAVKQNKLTG